MKYSKKLIFIINKSECVNVLWLNKILIKKLVSLNCFFILFCVWYIFGNIFEMIESIIIDIEVNIFVWKYCVVIVLIKKLYDVCVLFVMFCFFL